MIKICWNHVYDTWLLRNTHQHDAKDAPVNFKKAQLLQEIREIYNLKDQMLSADRDIFATSLDTRKHQSIMQLQEFTKFAKQITRRSIADAKENGKNFKNIRQYFTEVKKNTTIVHIDKRKNPNTNGAPRTWKRNTQGTLESHLV